MENYNNEAQENNIIFSNWVKNLVLAIDIILLALAILGGWSYGYYTFLRITIFVTNIFLAFVSFNKEKFGWIWFFGLIAFIFNPIFPFYLGRSIWVIVDWVVAIFFFVSIFTFRLQRVKKEKGEGYE